jgi:coatomer protein complex subunit alpha (xenin)
VSYHTGLIEIWNYQTKTKEYEFDGLDQPVRTVHFHPDLPLFASGGDDFCIRVWNYEQKSCDIVLLGHLDYIRAVKFHHQHSLLLSCSDDQTIRLWNIYEKKCIAILLGHRHYVMSAAFHPTEDLIVSASLDQTIRVWDFHLLRQEDGSYSQDPVGFCGKKGSAVVRLVLEGHSRGVNWVSFHAADPTMIISASDDHTVKFWKQTPHNQVSFIISFLSFPFFIGTERSFCCSVAMGGEDIQWSFPQCLECCDIAATARSDRVRV